MLAGAVLQLSSSAGATGPVAWSSVQSLHGASTVTLGSATSTSPFVSCWAPGDCSASGTYDDHSGNTLSYVDVEDGGTWKPARDVTGVVAGAVSVQITAMSCSTLGSCLAIGYYTTLAEEQSFFGSGTPFLVEEVGGVWHPAIKVPGLAALDQYASTGLDAVSCSSAGNCAVAGTYYLRQTYPTYVADETDGKWSGARELAGQKAAGLAPGGLIEAIPQTISCESAGDCILGGYLSDGGQYSTAYLAEEKGGAWGSAEQVPGLSALNEGSSALIDAASCSSAGNCSVGGTYSDANTAPQAFVADEKSGVWTSAVEVPGTAALNEGGGETGQDGTIFGAQVQTLSCDGDGQCTMVGWYQTLAGASDLFVDSMTGGAWATAVPMPGLAGLNAGAGLSNDGASAAGLSCASVGNCTIVGSYVDATGNAQIFTETQASGTFGTATELPGSATMASTEFADPFAVTVDSLSCWDASDCVLAGVDLPGGFLDVDAAGSWATAPTKVVTSATLFVGTNAEVDRISCPKTGECATIGTYETSTGVTGYFFAQQAHGVWGADVSLSALATLAPDGAFVDSFSCAFAGRCVLIGTYEADDVNNLFYENEVGGRWQAPQTITGLPTVTKGTSPYLFFGPQLLSVSCANVANCVMTGAVITTRTTEVPFLVTESRGVWSVNLHEPGSTISGDPGLSLVSCPSPGDCVATGVRAEPSGARELFTTTEVNGTWGRPQLLPSATALSPLKGTLKDAYLFNLDCASTTSCAAAGYVDAASGNSVPFVMSKFDGVWRRAEHLPGFKAIEKVVPNEGYDEISTVSLNCLTRSSCVLIGTYPVDFQDGFFSFNASFELTWRNGTWSPLVLLANPRSTKKGKVSSTYDFDASGLACTSATTCFVVGITEQTITTQVTDGEDFNYGYAVSDAREVGSRFTAPVDLSRSFQTYDDPPWSINDVSCGANGEVGACGMGGSLDEVKATVPFVVATT